MYVYMYELFSNVKKKVFLAIFFGSQQVAFVPTFHFQMGSQNSAPRARVSCRDLRHDRLPLPYCKRSSLLVYFKKFLVRVLIPFSVQLCRFPYGWSYYNYYL